jgi:hypothetical protein
VVDQYPQTRNRGAASIIVRDRLLQLDPKTPAPTGFSFASARAEYRMDIPRVLLPRAPAHNRLRRTPVLTYQC